MEDIRASMESKMPPETVASQESDRIDHRDETAKCREGHPRGHGGTLERSRTPVHTSLEPDEQRLPCDVAQSGSKVDRLRRREHYRSRSRSRERGHGSQGYSGSRERGRGSQRPRSRSREERQPRSMQGHRHDAQPQLQEPPGGQVSQTRGGVSQTGGGVSQIGGGVSQTGTGMSQTGTGVSQTGSRRSRSRSRDGRHRSSRTHSQERHHHHRHRHKSKSPLQRHIKHKADHNRK